MLLSLALAASGVFSPARAAEYAKPVSNRLNTTGRTLTIPLPVKSDGVAAGEVTARIDKDDNVSLSKADLVARLGNLLDPATQQVIASADADAEFVSLAALNAAGIKASFDPGLQEVEFSFTADQHQDGEIRLTRTPRPRISANAATAADVSGFVNLRGGFDTVWADSHRPDARDTRTSGRLEIESALRLVTLVFENRSVLEGDVDANSCPEEALCDYQHLPGLKRQSSRLVYDMPGERIRVMVGDSEPIATGFQRSTELLGVSLQKSDRTMSPGDVIVPTGSSSFRIERTSDVDVIVNGIVMQRLHLRPGDYNLRDLPLATGANNIELAITDETGEKRTIAFTTYFDGALLAAGQSEWAVGAGLPSYLRDNERYYADGIYAGHGSLRYGLSEGVTAEAILHGDTNVAVAGLGFLMQSPWGVFGLRGAGSWGTSDPGAALDAHWDLVNFNGLMGKGGESLRLSAELRSSDFRTSGEYYDTQTGILYPEFNHWLSLFADYSLQIFDDTTAAISARYRVHNDEHPVLSPYTVVGDRYGFDVSLSRPIADSVNASLTLGYSNESYLRRDFSQNTQDGEIRVGVRVSMRTEDDTMLAAGYDSMRRTGEFSGHRSSGSGVGSWDASVIAQNREDDQSVNANASVDYRGNRADIRLSHYSQADGLSWSRFEPEPGLQRTSLRVGTAIAFANDKIAIGAPVRGDAFAIVYPHESIADKEVTVGEGETVRAVSDGLGPALVGDIPAYRPATVPVDVADLPVGYSLGAGTFDTYAPFRGGFDLEVGSSHSVTVYGTLLDADGAPLALLAGTAHAKDDPARQVQVFTNAAGRFGAEGLGEGQWIIEMPADAGTIRYIVHIPPQLPGAAQGGRTVSIGVTLAMKRFTLLSILLLAMLWVIPATEAFATCTIRAVGLSINPGTGSTGTYTQPTPPAAQGVTFTVTGTYRTNNNPDLTCTVAISFNRSSLPASMAISGGGATLPYTIRSAPGGGNTLLYTGGGIPSAANRLAVSFTAAGMNLGSVPFSIQLTAYFLAQPGSPQRAGNYSDSLTLNVYNVTTAGVAALRLSRAFTTTGTVAPACTIGGVYMPAADSANIPVSPSGVVNTATINRSFSSIVCSAPANVQLISQSGAVRNAAAAVSGFSNQINYSATASFSGASATINTATNPAASGPETGAASTTSGVTPNGTMSVTVTPATSGSPLLAGGYSDTLRITITPQ